MRELHAILSSPQFCNSKRYPALLEYIVKNTLAGRADLLKERTLGVEVFSRQPTYDTNADTVVRYTAGEVRKRLLLYYSEHGRDSDIRISLPAGSYVPEFSSGDEPRAIETSQKPLVHEPELAIAQDAMSPASLVASPLASPLNARNTHKRHLWLIVATTTLLIAAAAGGVWWRHSTRSPQSAFDAFWAPVLHDARPVMICTGSVVFAQNNYSGVTTAGRDLDYTFVSMQIATAIAQISDIAVSSGATSQLVFSASTPLTELREHPVILLGGYNNQWTLRLLDPLRFHFEPNPGEKIVDRMQPNTQWERDRSLPYSSADDYAIVARFRGSAIDGWVVVIAGLGRNGTEAAAHFVTNPHYVQLLRERLGNEFAEKNLEVVLKVNVVDGKSGAPSILAVHSW